MAYTYRWQECIDFLRSYARSIPVDAIAPTICDHVSSEMWSLYPWKDTCNTFAPFLLADDTQDYDSQPEIFKIVSAYIIQLSPSPDSFDPLDVVSAIPYVTEARSPRFIRRISIERGEGLIRFDYRTTVNAGESWECHGTYQFQHRRVTALSQPCWFKDQLFHAACEGLLYYGYKLGDNPGTASAQYKLFRQKVTEAWQQEEGGVADEIYPADGSIGAGWRGGS